MLKNDVMKRSVIIFNIFVLIIGMIVYLNLRQD